MELYYLAFPLGFVISFLVYWGLNVIDEPTGVDEMDEVDYFGTFTPEEAQKMGLREASDIEGVEVVHQNKGSEVKAY
jgi:NCS1 family nucleobase:cation symporter-1